MCHVLAMAALYVGTPYVAPPGPAPPATEAGMPSAAAPGYGYARHSGDAGQFCHALVLLRLQSMPLASV